MSTALKVAIAGLGTVGSGTVALLEQHAALIGRRAGRSVEIVAVSSLEPPSPAIPGARFYADARVMAAEADYDILAELIGGAHGIALEIVRTALTRGKNVVTANKAMIAHHGLELAELAEAKNASFRFEASVGGGIPAIKALKEGLIGNDINLVYGILNGTCNYILTTMRETGRDFSDVLDEAQKLGYAEADPSFDIDGVDTAHKISILASLAFGTEIGFSAVHTDGIRSITATDIRLAEELGYSIRLLGVARRVEGGVMQGVYPCMAPLSSPVARIDGVFNAVVFEGDFVDRVLLEGRGAGSHPTASAVVADIADEAAGRKTMMFGLPRRSLAPLKVVSLDQRIGSYYLRLAVIDKPGVFADIAAALRDEQVSIESVLQRGRKPGEEVALVLTTHETKEAAMLRALERIAALSSVMEPPRMIRIENF